MWTFYYTSFCNFLKKVSSASKTQFLSKSLIKACLLKTQNGIVIWFIFNSRYVVQLLT